MHAQDVLTIERVIQDVEVIPACSKYVCCTSAVVFTNAQSLAGRGETIDSVCECWASFLGVSRNERKIRGNVLFKRKCPVFVSACSADR